MTRILLTGGSGFLGTALLGSAVFSDAVVAGRTRPTATNKFVSMQLDSSSDYTDILGGIDVVVHVAARAHVMDDASSDPLSEFRNINTLATLNLAGQAANLGVKRFVFISSIKVLGETTEGRPPFSYLDALNAQDPYGVSKAEAETGLREIAERSNMEIVIIRPPLVYGKGVKGNFAKLLYLTSLELPLPLRSVGNKRSLVAVENLVDLICICITHERAKNQVFLVSDGNDMSTPELLSLISKTGNFKSRLFGVPKWLLLFASMCLGKLAVYERLCGSMEVDISHTRSVLEWDPPFDPEDCIQNCWPKNT